MPRATWVPLSGPRPRSAGPPPRGGPVVARAGGFSPSCPPSSSPLCTHTHAHSEQRRSVGMHTHTRPTYTHTHAPSSAHTCGTTRVRARHARARTHAHRGHGSYLNMRVHTPTRAGVRTHVYAHGTHLFSARVHTRTCAQTQAHTHSFLKPEPPQARASHKERKAVHRWCRSEWKVPEDLHFRLF